MNHEPDEKGHEPAPSGHEMPEETPHLAAAQEHDPVVVAVEGAVGVGAVKAERVVEAGSADVIPAPKSSLKILLPVLLVLVVFAVWGFMPQGMPPELAKLGKVTDKGSHFEIEFPGDAYAASTELGVILPELMPGTAKEPEGGVPVQPYSDGKVQLEVLGAQDKKPTIIRVIKSPNYAKLIK